jgi:LAS superfamily LD-carboxypeptidase LdcB
LNALELTGRAASHITALPQIGALHHDVVAPFLAMRRAALAAGIDLVPVSSFRDFSRQLSIWNDKFSGVRPLYDAAGGVIDSTRLSPRERVAAILNWSAIPGASRHHWGTDLDLIDRGATAPGYSVRLNAAEYEPPGPYAPLAEWLAGNASRFGFFRPYRGVASAVQPEPWHYSFAPIAESARRELNSTVLREALMEAPVQGKDALLAELEVLHDRYVVRVDWP